MPVNDAGPKGGGFPKGVDTRRYANKNVGPKGGGFPKRGRHKGCASKDAVPKSGGFGGVPH